MLTLTAKMPQIDFTKQPLSPKFIHKGRASPQFFVLVGLAYLETNSVMNSDRQWTAVSAGRRSGPERNRLDYTYRVKA